MSAHTWGRVIFISSESAVQIPAEMIHYGVTKIVQVEVEREFFQTARPSSLLRRFASPVSSATNGAALQADGGVVRAVL